MERKRRETVKEDKENLTFKMEGERKGRKLASHFLKPLKFVWGVPKWKFLGGKIGKWEIF